MIRLPSFEEVANWPMCCMPMPTRCSASLNQSRQCASALVQRHGERDVWINPPAYSTDHRKEMDYVFDLPYARLPHPPMGMHVSQHLTWSSSRSRSCVAVLVAVHLFDYGAWGADYPEPFGRLDFTWNWKDPWYAPNFTGIISDLGGPTANMYRLHCNDPEIGKNCRKPSLSTQAYARTCTLIMRHW